MSETSRPNNHFQWWQWVLVTVIPLIGSSFIWVVNESRADTDREINRAQTIVEQTEARFAKILEEERQTTDLWKVRAIESQSREITTLEELTKYKLAALNTDVSPIEIATQIIKEDPGVSWFVYMTDDVNYTVGAVSRGYAQTFLSGFSSIYNATKTDFDVWSESTAFVFASMYKKAVKDTSVTFEIPIEDRGVNGVFVGRMWSVSTKNGDQFIFSSGHFVPLVVE